MKVNLKLSIAAANIVEALKKSDLSPLEEIEVLSVLLIKKFFKHCENDKDSFIKMLEGLYDELEEEANRIGLPL